MNMHMVGGRYEVTSDWLLACDPRAASPTFAMPHYSPTTFLLRSVKMDKMTHNTRYCHISHTSIQIISV